MKERFFLLILVQKQMIQQLKFYGCLIYVEVIPKKEKLFQELMVIMELLLGAASMTGKPYISRFWNAVGRFYSC